MRARILRGSNQVGGSLVELYEGGERLVLDVGMPLEQTASRDLLPDVDGLWNEGDGSLKGVFVTHGHPDHYGLADLVDGSVPIFMGEAAKSVIEAASFFTRREPGFTCASFLEHGRPIELGPFTVTPLLVDHSGFDAYSLLVQAGGDSLFYTGDIRFHGRKSVRMNHLASKLPDDLDCLLMEGTNYGRPESTRLPASERDLEEQLATAFRGLEGAALCFYSAQNIDRLVTLFRAAKRSGRILILDLYGSSIAVATGRDTIPQHSWSNVAVCVREAERQNVLRTKEFDRVDEIKRDRIFREAIASEPARYVLTGRKSSIAELGNSNCLENARAFWCQWQGYLDSDRELERTLERFGVKIEMAHVSGHATADDLTDFASKVGALQTTLIHTTARHHLSGQVASHQPREDRQWWSVGDRS